VRVGYRSSNLVFLSFSSRCRERRERKTCKASQKKGRVSSRMLPPADEEEASCRICLEPAPNGVAPCECSGTCRTVHVECLERWIVERGSAGCEVCKAPYAENALTELGRKRIAERERLRLEWPQHDTLEAEELALLAPPTLALPATRRLLLLAMLSLSVVFFLAQEDGSGLGGFGANHVRLTDSEAQRYILDLGLGAPVPGRGEGGGGGAASAILAAHTAAAYAPHAPAPAPAVLDRPFFADNGQATDDHEQREQYEREIHQQHEQQQEQQRQRQRQRESARLGDEPLSPPTTASYLASLASSWVGSTPTTHIPRAGASPPPVRTTRYEYADTFPDDQAGSEDHGGASDGPLGGGPLPPSGPAAVASAAPVADTESLLQQLMWEEGCTTDHLPPPPPPPAAGGDGSGRVGGSSPDGGGGEQHEAAPGGGTTSTTTTTTTTTTAEPHHERSRCDKAELVLAHLRRRHADEREAHAERQASEAVERLTRAFVLLCMLRILIAQQQRRRILMERAAAQAAARDPRRLPRALNNV
jgi:hypothetical protein